MLMINAFTILALVYMAVAVVHIVYSFASADRKGRCRLLRNYKKGKFAAIFVAALPLYAAAYFNNGENLLHIVINSFDSTLGIVALSFDLDVLEPLASANLLFHIAIALCFLLAVANAVLFSVSLLFRFLFNRRILRNIKQGKKDVCVLVGYGEKGKHILDSLETRRASIDVLVLPFSIDDEFKEHMYASRAAYVQFSPSDDLSKILTEACGKFDKRHCTVILLAHEEEENLKMAFCAAKLADSITQSLPFDSNRHIGLDTYLFSGNAGETLYRQIVSTSHGTVHCINRYQMLADDFSLRYPITELIPDLIDTHHAALKEGTDFRILMVGFGKVNRQLFRVYTQNNQCMVMDGDMPRENPLSYYIFDKNKSYEESSFNHTYLHYRNWKKTLSDSNDYFELPAEPANVVFEEIDINKSNFSEKLISALTRGDKGFNMIVVALGKDIEALDLSEKIAVDIRDSGLEDKAAIFVRIRNHSLLSEIKRVSDSELPIIPFGDDLSLYTYDRIVNPAVESMAKDRHLCYSLENIPQGQTEQEIIREAHQTWLFKWETIQRQSNIYAVLTIRMRLQLLGYDCAPCSDPAADATKEFFDDYTNGNPIKYAGQTINGKKIVDYKTDYRRPGTPRSVLAETEHSRWNAWYICNGFIPASKTEFKELGKTELMRRRRHINLTTFRGLDDYDTWRTAPDTPTAQKPDVIFYDYQLMDDAAWILGRNGYKIIRRK